MCLSRVFNWLNKSTTFFKISLSCSVLIVLRSLSSKITTHLHCCRTWVVLFLWSQVPQFHLLSHTSTVLWNPSTAHVYNYHHHYTEERKLQCEGDGLLHRSVVCILNLSIKKKYNANVTQDIFIPTMLFLYFKRYRFFSWDLEDRNWLTRECSPCENSYL